ncbi:alpha-tocopherol transfer protein-like isoform X2 [Adelges cooleyi]|uniref:alpha-tocopherol transfer protein-like isoform X2 n=1 Tax=Adelges cooleyi TaxID=133065 RepID=UPI00217FBF07|nr:alpha-tocopherol transfer protein-like isoform X2 [Adelges cooleyi]XP_050436186.1 alpha-tocopherol transfer protein-like isoform X2 [Adelges cooleyi]
MKVQFFFSATNIWLLFAVFTDVACMHTSTSNTLDIFENKEQDDNSELKKGDIDDVEEKVKQNPELAGLQVTDVASTSTTSALDTFEKEALKKNPELTKEEISSIFLSSIDEIEKNVKKNPLLAGLQITRKEIIIFLHSSEYRPERAYKMLATSYQYRMELPVLFQKIDLNSEQMKRVPEALCFSILPIEYGPDNECHIYVAFLKLGLDDFDYVNTIRYFFMLIEYLLKTKGTFKGISVYLDAQGATMAHVRKIPLLMLFKILKFVQGGLPVRLKAINVININNGFKYFLQLLLWTKLKDTIIDKIHFYTKAKELSLKDEMKPIWQYMPLEINGKWASQAEQSQNTYNAMLKVNAWYLYRQEKYQILLDRASQSINPKSKLANKDDKQTGKQKNKR